MVFFDRFLIGMENENKKIIILNIEKFAPEFSILMKQMINLLFILKLIVFDINQKTFKI